MARIRSIKPEFWSDLALARLSRDARLLYIALWNQSDEWGRLHGDPRWVKGHCLPYDDDLNLVAIEVLLQELARAGKVVQYVVDDSPYLFLPKLDAHQRLEAAKVPSRLPAPPEPGDPSLFEHGDSTDPDESESRADESAPIVVQQVAGSREQVAGSKDSSSEAAPRDDVEAVCQRLAEWMIRNDCREPRITAKWRNEARLILDRDGRPLAEVLDLIDWCQTHAFWKSNIQSVPKLREKYDTLRLQRDRRGLPPGPRPSTTDQRVAQAQALKARFQQEPPPEHHDYDEPRLAIGGTA